MVPNLLFHFDHRRLFYSEMITIFIQQNSKIWRSFFQWSSWYNFSHAGHFKHTFYGTQYIYIHISFIGATQLTLSDPFFEFWEENYVYVIYVNNEHPNSFTKL